MRADEVVHRKQLNVTELVHHQNVQHVSAEAVVLSTIGFSHLSIRSYE